MISGASPAEKPPAWVAQWFRRGGPLLAEGHYSVRDRSIKISLRTQLPEALPESLLGSVARTLQYSGLVGPGYIVLRRNGSGPERKYYFVRVQFAK